MPSSVGNVSSFVEDRNDFVLKLKFVGEGGK
jgi:hypothetical protein